MIDYAARFWSKVEKTEGCWVWQGVTDKDGYGHFSQGRSTGSRSPQMAHRVAFALERGPIQTGLHVLHHCDNPPCVRPDHLFLGTNVDNVRDRMQKGRQGRTVRHCGSRNGQSRLTEPQVLEMWALFNTGNHSVGALAARFGCSYPNAWKITHGRGWKDLLQKESPSA